MHYNIIFLKKNQLFFAVLIKIYADIIILNAYITIFSRKKPFYVIFIGLNSDKSEKFQHKIESIIYLLLFYGCSDTKANFFEILDISENFIILRSQ